MSIQTATEQLKTIMDSISYYQTTSVGLTYDFARLKDNDFPLIHASISETSIDVGTTVITYEVISIDLPNEAQTDLMTKLYATHSNLNTVISNYINTNEGYVPQLPVTIEPLDYFVEHSACGWRAFLSIEISNENSVC